MPRGKPSLFHTRSSVSGCPATRLRGTFYCSLHCLLGGKIAIDSSTIHPPTHDQAGCARGTPVAPRVLRPIPRRPTPKIKRLTHPNSRGHEGQRFRSVPFAIGCLHNEHTPDSFTHVTSGAQTRWSSSVSHTPPGSKNQQLKETFLMPFSGGSAHCTARAHYSPTWAALHTVVAYRTALHTDRCDSSTAGSSE
jgi:hypothetical protein